MARGRRLVLGLLLLFVFLSTSLVFWSESRRPPRSALAREAATYDARETIRGTRDVLERQEDDPAEPGEHGPWEPRSDGPWAPRDDRVPPVPPGPGLSLLLATSSELKIDDAPDAPDARDDGDDDGDGDAEEPWDTEEDPDAPVDDGTRENWVYQDLPRVALQGQEACGLVNARGEALYTGSRFPYYPPLPDIGHLPPDWCFNHSASFRPLAPTHAEQGVLFHTYWRSDLSPFGPLNVAAVQSFLATQEESYVLTIWSNNATALRQAELLRPFLERYPNRIRVLDYRARRLAKGSPMQGSKYLRLKDKMAWLDGDLGRYLVLYQYGGVWVDFDTIYLRSFAPLMGYEFVADMHCNHTYDLVTNGAIMRFRKKSPYICMVLTLITNSPPPRKGSYDWGPALLKRAFSALHHANMPTFGVLPYCFTDPSMCSSEASLPWATTVLDPMPTDKISAQLSSIFGYHWHNQYKSELKDGMLLVYLMKQSAERFVAKYGSP